MRGGASRRVGRTLRMSCGSFMQALGEGHRHAAAHGQELDHHALRDVRGRQERHGGIVRPEGSTAAPCRCWRRWRCVRDQRHLRLAGGAGGQVEDGVVGGPDFSDLMRQAVPGRVPGLRGPWRGGRSSVMAPSASPVSRIQWATLALAQGFERLRIFDEDGAWRRRRRGCAPGRAPGSSDTGPRRWSRWP